MESIFATGAVASAFCYIYLRVSKPTTNVAAEKAAEFTRLEQSALAEFRKDVWHFVIPSLAPDSEDEFILAEETRKWLAASGNPTGVKVFVCHYRDIDNPFESWQEYQIRLKAFRAQVKAERVAEFKNAENTEGGLSWYQQYVLGKKAPQMVSFTPVFLATGMTTNEFFLALMGTIFFCIWGGRKMDKKTRSPRKQPANNPQTKKGNNAQSPQGHIEAANRELAKAGFTIDVTQQGLQLKRKEGQNG